LALKGLDNVFVSVDETFCSSECPCYILPSSQQQFASNSTVYQTYANWTQGNDVSVTNFQHCPQQAKIQMYADYNKAYNTDLNDDSLMPYLEIFQMMEQRLQCSGICTTSYENSNLNKKVTMYKYLFNDINR
jgi:hypothetical protein